MSRYANPAGPTAGRKRRVSTRNASIIAQTSRDRTRASRHPEAILSNRAGWVVRGW